MSKRFLLVPIIDKLLNFCLILIEKVPLLSVHDTRALQHVCGRHLVRRINEAIPDTQAANVDPEVVIFTKKHE